MNTRPVIGILGGMGPRATIEFEKRLVSRFDGRDQAIPPIITINDGSIPDRTAFLVADGADPVIQLTKNANQLLELGASIICMPCNTAHAAPILDKLQNELNLPLVNMPLGCLAQAAAAGCQSVLILGTEGTRLSGVFEPDHQLRCVYPGEATQQLVNQVIQSVKCGRLVTDQQIQHLKQATTDAGTDVTILACTELSLLNDRLACSRVIDSLDVLARLSYEQAILAYTNT